MDKNRLWLKMLFFAMAYESSQYTNIYSYG